MDTEISTKSELVNMMSLTCNSAQASIRLFTVMLQEDVFKNNLTETERDTIIQLRKDARIHIANIEWNMAYLAGDYSENGEDNAKTL